MQIGGSEEENQDGTLPEIMNTRAMCIRRFKKNAKFDKRDVSVCQTGVDVVVVGTMWRMMVRGWRSPEDWSSTD